jgi:antitoxin YefM
MEIVNYTTFRQNLAAMMDAVNANHAPLLITRQNAAPAVLLSLEDFKAFEETAYLMASPRNAARLHAAIDQLRGGGGTARAPLDP